MKSELTRSEEIVEGKNWGWLVLFATSTTLVCCALPIMLVTVGFGAVSAALFSNLPFLVTLAKFKLWFFTGSGGPASPSAFAHPPRAASVTSANRQREGWE